MAFRNRLKVLQSQFSDRLIRFPINLWDKVARPNAITVKDLSEALELANMESTDARLHPSEPSLREMKDEMDQSCSNSFNYRQEPEEVKNRLFFNSHYQEVFNGLGQNMRPLVDRLKSRMMARRQAAAEGWRQKIRQAETDLMLLVSMPADWTLCGILPMSFPLLGLEAEIKLFLCFDYVIFFDTKNMQIVVEKLTAITQAYIIDSLLCAPSSSDLLPKCLMEIVRGYLGFDPAKVVERQATNK